MKILAFTESYASNTVTFITNEVKEVDKKHTLKLICNERINSDKFELNDIEVIPYKFNRVFNKIRWWLEKSSALYWLTNYKFKKNINATIDEFAPEVIHCHFGTSFLVLAANLSKKNKEIPMVVSFYGFDASERLKNKAVVRAYQRFMLKNVRSVAVSQNLVNNINTIINPINKATVLYSGIDVNFFKRNPQINNSSDFTFLQIASFREKKGHVYALESFKKLVDNQPSLKLKFIIAGFGPLKNKIENKISELSLGDYVELQGVVSPGELRKLASESNCFVHHSVTSSNGDVEGLPNVLLDIMSCELPILSTYHGGIPHIVENNVNGYLVQEKDVDGFFKAMKNVLKWDYCQQNRQKIIDVFSFEKHMETLEKIYNDQTK